MAESLVENDGPADVYLQKGDGWKAYSTLARAAVAALAKGLDRPWERTNIVILGAGSDAKSIASDLAKRGGIVSVSAFDDKSAAAVAKAADCRHLPFASLYQSLADVVILADPAVTSGRSRTDVNEGYLKPEMTVVDLTDPPIAHPLTQEATLRGCQVIDPVETYRQHMTALFKTLSGGEALPDAAWQCVLSRTAEIE